MRKGINAQTIEKLNTVCETFYDGQLSGNSEQVLLEDYKRLLDVREDMRQQSEPISGRFINADDRSAIVHALDAIHCTIMGRTYEQSQPISGRFINADDRSAIVHALGALHCTIMGRTYEKPICVIYTELECLLEYLRGSVK